MKTPKIEARNQPSASRKLPWLVYIDDVMLRSSNGVGRRFATKEAAETAAGIVALGNAVAYVQEHHPLPRCHHGNALRDGGWDTLEPSCGCRS